MNEIGWVLIAFASSVVAVNVALVLALRAVYKRVKRTLSLNGTALRIRAGLSRGPRREILNLRLRLAATLDSGQAAIDLAALSDSPRGELPRLFRRLQNEAGRIESQLRLLESENDATVRADALRAARRSVDDVTHLVSRLRSAVGSGLGDSSTALTGLRSEVDREVTALRAGMDEFHELNRRDARSDLSRRASPDLFTRE